MTKIRNIAENTRVYTPKNITNSKGRPKKRGTQNAPRLSQDDEYPARSCPPGREATGKARNTKQNKRTTNQN